MLPARLKISSICLLLAASVAAWENPNPNAQPIDLDRGAPGLTRALAELRTRASLLMVVAHPDDEDGGMLAAESRGRGTRASLLTLTRGEGGQNAMTMDMYDEMGLIRTQELLRAGQFYGVDQYWANSIDYGFSKTREEALEKWGYERVLSDVVRVVRMTRPLVITSVFVGAATDGHGNHQVAGQMAQEAFVAAGDPTRFPEQIKQGLRPWSPLKMYARVPFFAPTKDKTIYDYATDKYVPIKFRDYVNKTWIMERPATNLEVQEGVQDPSSGLTYLQISRTGWGYQKTQYGGATTPQPAPYSAAYHRYGSRVTAAGKEKTFYDGVDVSLAGIADLTSGNNAFLKEDLAKIDALLNAACDRFKPTAPGLIAPDLAEGLKLTRSLKARLHASSLPEPGKSDALFELGVKETQFQHALVLALGLSVDTAVAPDKEPENRPGGGGGQSVTFTMAIPGQKFAVQSNIMNEGAEEVHLSSLEVVPSDGKQWKITPEKPAEAAIKGGTEWKVKFAVVAPADAALTRAYFSRPDHEQPYYNVNDERYRNLSLAPYPLSAVAHFSYHDADLQIDKVVQANSRVQGIGIVEDPMLMVPAISVSLASTGGAVPLEAKAFPFACTLRSNVKGAAAGTLRLSLPQGWTSTPAEAPFSFAHDGEGQTFNFQVTPRDIQQKDYELRAVAEYKGKTYAEGYRMVGYPGIRPYPAYTPASYKAVGVNVKMAPGLHVGFLAGTGDDVPRALEDLGVHPQMLTAADVENADLSHFDAIILGVRAYAVRPELPSANARLLDYVKNGGVLIVQYNLQNFDRDYGPYPFSLGSNPEKVVDESSSIKLLEPANPAFSWPNKISTDDFKGWEEERGHGFLKSWDPRYTALIETHDPEQDPQSGGLLLARYGRGFYIYDAFALYRQLPSGVPGAYRILANLVSVSKNPAWK
jgi:LmbE family N-acetylglucosaminyl deacetylase